jgi:tetratricopeptide (TPR) repeat protein
VKYEVGLEDVALTLLELLHLPALAGADGRSLLPLIRGEQKGAQDYEMETLYPSFSYGWAPLRAFCSGSYKYIEAPRPELYELPTDPGELHDLSQLRAARATELRAALADRTRGDAVAAPADDPETRERRDRLASLGYVSGSVSPATGALDPKDGVKLLGDLDAARQAIQLGDPKDALAPLTRLIAKNPGNIPARLLLGQAQLAVGKSDDAVATYRAVTGLAPNNALAWFNLGNAHAGKAAGDDAAFAEAKRCYDRAVLLSPRHADTYLNLAALYAARKDPESSRQTLLRARAALVSDPTLETELGLLEAGRKDAPAARAAFERALVLNPRQAEALEGMGQLDYAAKDYAAAAGYYERALAAYPATSIAKTLGAIRLYQLNDRAGARAAFSRALALAPAGDPDVPDLQALIDELGH